MAQTLTDKGLQIVTNLEDFRKIQDGLGEYLDGDMRTVLVYSPESFTNLSLKTIYSAPRQNGFMQLCQGGDREIFRNEEITCMWRPLPEIVQQMITQDKRILIINWIRALRSENAELKAKYKHAEKMRIRYRKELKRHQGQNK